jgi:glycosyltransferase involved in cell wall biosynthesis
MRIGFDAKRAYFNRSGLGNYSRDTIRSLHHNFPGEDYFLYTPTLKNTVAFINNNTNIHPCTPAYTLGKVGGAYWRSFRLGHRMKRDRIDIFHGLSNELPYDLNRKSLKSVVTIHDLIFMRHPEWYKPIDRAIYLKKFRFSSEIADCVVTVSRQTKKDLVGYFGTDENKIEVIYQGCNEAFKTLLTKEQKVIVKKKWSLPEEYILYVGTVEERKNLLSIIKALHQKKLSIPLVVIGRHTRYISQVQSYIEKYSLKHILFLKEVPVTDLPGIYQMASVFIYPSLFEGFGIPILEALFSKVPVITSSGGCFNEVGGESATYIDPLNTDELGDTLVKLLNDTLLMEALKTSGYMHAQQFSGENSARQLMNIYKKLLNG